jgi:hypothetical protein
MNINKMMKAPSNRVFGMILLFGLIVLVVILMKYNQTKSSSKERMTVKFAPSVYDLSSNGSDMLSHSNSPHLEVNGMHSQSPPSSCNNENNLNPSDLLPKDMNSEWSDVNPASNDLKNVNLLTANQMIGINTVSSSLRNANYQVRSEPIIAKTDVGPWYHSTIEPDLHRRPLELG